MRKSSRPIELPRDGLAGARGRSVMCSPSTPTLPGQGIAANVLPRQSFADHYRIHIA